MASAFDFNELKLDYSKDPKYIYLEESFRCLMVSVIANLSVSLRLTKEQKFDGCDKLDAGDIFNGLMIKNHGQSDPSDELSPEELMEIATVFKQQVEKQNHLKIYALKQANPIDCLFDLLHYMFVPIRLDASTIPEGVKFHSLRRWLTLVMTLPFQFIYSTQYENTINGITFLHEATEKMFSNEQVLQRISSVAPDFVMKTIARNRTSNSTQHFIRLVSHLIIILSIEILRKYCPNIVECCRINPSFNGVWLNLAFDNMFQQQVSELTKITECLEIESS